MIIRPLLAGELPDFARVCGRGSHAVDVERYLRDMFQAGNMRPEWCFVALEGERISGTLAYWKLSALERPSDLVLLELPWERDDYLSFGTQFIGGVLSAFPGLEALGYVLDQPVAYPQWQEFPERRAELLRRLDFRCLRQTRRFEWRGGPAPVVSPRLIFRSLSEVGEEAFIAAIEEVSEGTFDQLILAERAELGPAEQARRLFADMQAMHYEPGWWQLAYTPEQALVGLIMPACGTNFATIGYIGVMPRWRGRRYVDDLLARGTVCLLDTGKERILADTDVGNVPIANAFLRAGYGQFGTRQDYKKVM
jgi:hypothetical protein